MSNAFIRERYSFNRPSAEHAAYGASDLVANHGTAADVVPLSWSVSRLAAGRGKILSATLYKDVAAATNASFLLNLYKTAPAPSVGDNGVFAIASARPFIGQIAMDMTTGGIAGTADLKKRFALTVPLYFDLQESGAAAIYGLLQTAATYDPAASELFEVELEIEGWAR